MLRRQHARGCVHGHQHLGQQVLMNGIGPKTWELSPCCCVSGDYYYNYPD